MKGKTMEKSFMVVSRSCPCKRQDNKNISKRGNWRLHCLVLCLGINERTSLFIVLKRQLCVLILRKNKCQSFRIFNKENSIYTPIIYAMA